jgi:hypothetical protein
MQNAPHSKKQEYTGNLPFMLDKEQHAPSHQEIISQHTMLQTWITKAHSGSKKENRESHIMAALILFWDLSVGEPSCYDIFSLN